MGGGEPGSETAENVKRWEAMEEPPRQTIAEKLAAVKTYFKGGWKQIIFGDYDYSYLCMPDFCPWKKGGRPPPPFYGVNQILPLTIMLLMGLQHALAMIGGLIVPPLLVGALANDPSTQRQLINTAMIVSGIFTLIHVIQLPIFGTKKMVYGTGILSVVGISFTFLQNTQSSIQLLLNEGYTFDEAYGKIMGTIMVCCWIVVAISFMPPRVIRRLFPPFVPGVVIFLIGAALIQSAFYNWGGGSYCGDYATGLPPTQIACQVPDGPNGSYVNGTCYGPAVIPLCSGNGHVMLPFGAPEYIGLGFTTFVILIGLELFGSPMLRNSQIIIALLLGYLIAGVVKRFHVTYVDTTNIKDSPGGTFLWVKTFPIGFYAPAVLPYLVSFIVVAVECIGDITATAEVSGIETAGPIHRRRIQGGLLADGVNCFFGALAFSLPSTTFAQNNGVISITRCASRSAGIACGCWLILLGIIAPIGAFFTSIPNCILGGVTSFLFANVSVSGIKIILLGDLSRRTRFILSLSLALGLGTVLVPDWATNHLWPIVPSMSSGLQGFRNACILVLSSGYSIGFLMAIILHLILPMEALPLAPDIIDVKKGLYDPTAPKGANEAGIEEEEDSDSPHKPVPHAEMYRDDTAGRPEPMGVESV